MIGQYSGDVIQMKVPHGSEILDVAAGNFVTNYRDQWLVFVMPEIISLFFPFSSAFFRCAGLFFSDPKYRGSHV
jgi:hypothetical protein